MHYLVVCLTDRPLSGVRLCFDVGQVRIGVAKCDRDQILSVPVTTLTVDNNTSTNIAELIAEIEPAAIYVGLPINLSGKNTQSTDSAIEFAEALVKTLSTTAAIEIRLIDERLSTSSALGSLRDSGKSAKASKGLVDQAAAVEILELALAIEKRTDELAGTEIPLQYK